MLQPSTNNTYVEVKQQVTKKIVNIDQWSDAFLIFIAIHTEHCPSDTQDILKYMQIIRTMAANSRTPAFLAYDKDFRKLRAHNSMPWCVIHQELFFSVNSTSPAAQSPVFPQSKHSSGKRQSFPAGYCFMFCSSGRCSNPRCVYKHTCPSCNGYHAMSQCTGRRPPVPATSTPNPGPRRPAFQTTKGK